MCVCMRACVHVHVCVHLCVHVYVCACPFILTDQGLQFFLIQPVFEIISTSFVLLIYVSPQLDMLTHCVWGPGITSQYGVQE